MAHSPPRNRASRDWEIHVSELLLAAIGIVLIVAALASDVFAGGCPCL